MKKPYMKPSMKVYSLHQQSQILAGSYPGEVYTPGLGTDDMNKLA